MNVQLGDGINDAPAFKAADVGISVNSASRASGGLATSLQDIHADAIDRPAHPFRVARVIADLPFVARLNHILVPERAPIPRRIRRVVPASEHKVDAELLVARAAKPWRAPRAGRRPAPSLEITRGIQGDYKGKAFPL